MSSRARILIVESVATAALKLQRIVHALGYGAPIAVSSGEEALQAAETIRFSLVLTELNLKGQMDGTETAKRISDRYDIEVVYMTSNLEESVMHLRRASRPYGCLLKPASERSLRRAIEAALSRNRARRASERPATPASHTRYRGCRASTATVRSGGVSMCAYQICEDESVPGSLESMGFTIDGYWEERQDGGEEAYLEPRFQLGTAGGSVTGPHRAIPEHQRPHDVSKQHIDCTGLDEVCRAADGSPYKVPRLRIRLGSRRTRKR